jgi:hypothetical protein
MVTIRRLGVAIVTTSKEEMAQILLTVELETTKYWQVQSFQEAICMSM